MRSTCVIERAHNIEFNGRWTSACVGIMNFDLEGIGISICISVESTVIVIDPWTISVCAGMGRTIVAHVEFTETWVLVVGKILGSMYESHTRKWHSGSSEAVLYLCVPPVFIGLTIRNGDSVATPQRPIQKRAIVGMVSQWCAIHKTCLYCKAT